MVSDDRVLFSERASPVRVIWAEKGNASGAGVGGEMGKRAVGRDYELECGECGKRRTEGGGMEEIGLIAQSMCEVFPEIPVSDGARNGEVFAFFQQMFRDNLPAIERPFVAGSEIRVRREQDGLGLGGNAQRGGDKEVRLVGGNTDFLGSAEVETHAMFGRFFPGIQGVSDEFFEVGVGWAEASFDVAFRKGLGGDAVFPNE